jgi:hypothetical protein
MPSDFTGAFDCLKGVLSPYAERLKVATDNQQEYTLLGTVSSPFPQHKGHPLEFARVRTGKAYVSFHLMPLYTVPAPVSAELKKRMQGKTCFNFKSEPSEEQLAELSRLTESAFQEWREKNWL